ncbi:MAG: hypothetical protein V4701_03115 [Pseudomonadota bacterium]
MKPGLRKLFVGASWLLMGLGLFGTLLMGLAVLGMQGSASQRIVSMVPAAVMLLTLGFGIGAVLRVLLSIDQKLESRT